MSKPGLYGFTQGSMLTPQNITDLANAIAARLAEVLPAAIAQALAAQQTDPESIGQDRRPR